MISEKKHLGLIRTAIRENLQKSSPDMEKLYSSQKLPRGIKARTILLRRHKESYYLILNIIQKSDEHPWK